MGERLATQPVADVVAFLPSPRWGEGPGVRGEPSRALPPTPNPSPQRGEGRKNKGTASACLAAEQPEPLLQPRDEAGGLLAAHLAHLPAAQLLHERADRDAHALGQLA